MTVSMRQSPGLVIRDAPQAALLTMRSEDCTVNKALILRSIAHAMRLEEWAARIALP
jgi:hypothetical protein